MNTHFISHLTWLYLIFLKIKNFTGKKRVIFQHRSNTEGGNSMEFVDKYKNRVYSELQVSNPDKISVQSCTEFL